MISRIEKCFLSNAFKAARDYHERGLPWEKACEIFAELEKMDNMGFGQISGCESRAYVMCEKLDRMGYPPLKAWAFKYEGVKPTGWRKIFSFLVAEEPEPLIINRPGLKPVEWNYHVAPVLPVAMPDGQKKNMVFDPGLYQGPVAVDEWLSNMHARSGLSQVISASGKLEGHPGGAYNHDRVYTRKEAQKLSTDMIKDSFSYEKVGQTFKSDLQRQYVQKQQTKKPEV